MTRPLGLHQITALEVSAPELVAIAHDVGCEHVTVFTHVPSPDLPFPAVTTSLVPELLARLDATGVVIGNIEIFPLTEEVDIEAYRPAVEVGARLGCRRLVTVVYDPDEARATESLVRLSELASEYGLGVGLEFMSLIPGCTTIEAAVGFIHRAGRSNIGLAVDPLHLVRSGGTPADVAAQPAELVAYAQLCDGLDTAATADYMGEVFDRTVPGEGVFPLAAFVEALPAATPIDVEVPSLSAAPPLERARRAVAGARAVLEGR
jgi:sugar phosphate isomerase/epimerase